MQAEERGRYTARLYIEECCSPLCRTAGNSERRRQLAEREPYTRCGGTHWGMQYTEEGRVRTSYVSHVMARTPPIHTSNYQQLKHADKHLTHSSSMYYRSFHVRMLYSVEFICRLRNCWRVA